MTAKTSQNLKFLNCLEDKCFCNFIEVSDFFCKVSDLKKSKQQQKQNKTKQNKTEFREVSCLNVTSFYVTD